MARLDCKWASRELFGGRGLGDGVIDMTLAVIWLTGLSGAGKTTIAQALVGLLNTRGDRSVVLDGDDLRRGLSSDLGFCDAARSENIRRAAEIAVLLARSHLIPIVSLISPFQKDRDLARKIANGIHFVEVYVDTPLEVCETRDPKGLYRRARAGLIAQFTGIDSPYETPVDPQIRIDTVKTKPLSAAIAIADYIGVQNSETPTIILQR